MASGVEVGTQKIAEGSEIIIRNEEVTILKITKQQSLPTTYNLEQNYPNPFNPSTTIKFSLPEATNVTLRIYNTLGQKVDELVNTNLEAGWYNYQWDANNIATGIYIYELRTDKFISVKKMILMK
jgi:flagellar hook assembly protein FlgD